MKSFVAILLFSMLLIIVYYIKKFLIANDDKKGGAIERDAELLDKIEPLEIQLLAKEKERQELVLQYQKVYNELSISEIYVDLEKKYKSGQINRESYEIQLEKILDQIDLKMIDLDLY